MESYRVAGGDIWASLRLQVGGIVMRYAEVEHKLDHIAVILFYYAGGKDYVAPGRARLEYKHYPDQRAKRHSLIQNCFDNIGSLSSLKQQWADLAAILENTEIRRHAIVHGIWDGKITSDNIVKFGRVTTKGGKSGAGELRISIDGLGNLLTVVEEFSRRLSDFTDRLEKQFVPEHLR